jgi:hypothetical protein
MSERDFSYRISDGCNKGSGTDNIDGVVANWGRIKAVKEILKIECEISRKPPPQKPAHLCLNYGDIQDRNLMLPRHIFRGDMVPVLVVTCRMWKEIESTLKSAF